jgi:single-strand DNA-binding protein
MSGINKAIIVGRLGQEPEIRYTAAGNPVANMSVATSKKYKGEEETEWHRIVCFGKLADVIKEYVHKGDLVGFDGELKTRKWQDAQGNDRYSTEIIAWKMDMLGSKNRGDDRPPADNHHPEKGHGHAPETASQEAPMDDGFDDIPF